MNSRNSKDSDFTSEVTKDSPIVQEIKIAGHIQNISGEIPLKGSSSRTNLAPDSRINLISRYLPSPPDKTPILLLTTLLINGPARMISEHCQPPEVLP